MSKIIPPRLVRASFDAASRTRESNRHFLGADKLSADAAMSQPIRHLIISRARQETSNNGYASGMLNTLARTTIGRGPRLQLFVSDSAPEGQDAAAKPALQRRLARWRNWTRQIRLTKKLVISRRSKCVDGEVFIRIVRNPKVRSHVKLDVQLVEAEQVQGDLFGMPSEVWDTGVPKEVDGIVFDRWGNVVKYRFLRVHPGSNALVVKGKKHVEADASEVIHYANIFRPGQARGLTEIAATLNVFNDLRRFTNATLTSAEIAAEISFLLETDTPPDDSSEGSTPPESPISFTDVVEFKKGAGTALPDGWKAKQLEAEHPNERYIDFCDSKLMEAARPISMPFNVAKGNSSSYNYASGRLDHQTYHQDIDCEREDIEQEILDRLLEVFEEIDSIVYPADYEAEKFIFHSWMWDGFGHVDPVKEATAQEKRLGTVATLQDECAKEGRDWEQVLRQRSREQRMKRDLGIVDDAQKAKATPQDNEEGKDDEDDK